MGSREDRIMSLAATLKASGLAKSEAQAKMMAEEMIGVEENVQKKYEEEHIKAHEYLRTTKNLGDPRIREQPQQEQKPKIEPMGTRIQPIPTLSSSSLSTVDRANSKNTLLKSVDESAHEKRVELEEVHTDVNFGKGSLKDLMLNQIKSENHEIKTIEQLGEEVEQAKTDSQKNVSEIAPEKTADIDELQEENVEEKTDEVVKADVREESVSKEKSEDSSKDESQESTSLDGDKLREMMEEDGPLEEHTREIKGKPEVVKPKEDYAENNIDLGNVFNFNKK